MLGFLEPLTSGCPGTYLEGEEYTAMFFQLRLLPVTVDEELMRHLSVFTVL